MTWLKIGEEFPLETANAELSDAAFRLHVEGLSYALDRENDGRFSEREVKRFAECKDPATALQDLLDAGFWQRVGAGELQIVHHMAEQPTAASLIDERKNAATRKRRERETKLLRTQGYSEDEVEKILEERGLKPKTSHTQSRRESRRDRESDPERNGTERSRAERNRASFDEGTSSESEAVQTNPDYCALPGCGAPLTGWLKRNGYKHCVPHQEVEAA